MPPRTRQEMAHLLEEIMSSAYSELLEQQRLTLDTTLVKTFVVEAHTRERAGQQDLLDLLRSTFGAVLERMDTGATIQETQEELFFTAEGKTRHGGLLLLFDATDTRFWLVKKSSSWVS